MIHTRAGLLTLALSAFGIAGLTPGSARAQQTPPPKPSAAVPQADTAPAGDAFLPPIRGTPDGRISGGTRGLELPSGKPGYPLAGSPQGAAPRNTH